MPADGMDIAFTRGDESKRRNAPMEPAVQTPVQTPVRTISREELKRRLELQNPDNDDRKAGYALVNVVDAKLFERDHIPSSINIPKDAVDEFERRFDKDKDIIVYCASPDCEASPEVARELSSRGFRHVYDYRNGMSDWRMAGHPVEGKSAP
jgi:rhodanese-related sulfurtransferase